MDNDIDEVDDDPFALLQSRLSVGWEVILFSQNGHFRGDRTDLLIAGAGGDDEVFGDGADVDEFQDHDVAAVAIVSETGDLAGPFAAGLNQIILRCW